MKKLWLRLLYALVVKLGQKEYDDNTPIYCVRYYLRPFEARYMDDGEYGTSTLDIMCPCCMRTVYRGWVVREVVTDPLARYS